MANTVPSGSGNVAIPPSVGVTSHTLPASGGAEVDFDQTIKIKAPGSGMMAFGRYRLDRVLGRGGMGVVWLAEDTKLERAVALKFLPSLIGLDPAAVKELKTETRRGLELSHPNIVRIYDFVDDEDAAAISMEFVDGKTLSELRMTTDHGVFTVDQLSKWLLGVCDALDYAHFQRRLIHRDLKPANIMLTSTDEVAKIADFGIARSLSDTMSRLSAAHIGTSGTLPYMSPQQAMGERPMPTDDVYSLGATIYELLSGKPPFYRGDLPTQINSKIPPSMQERRLELDIGGPDLVPKLWEDAIAACLHKDPAMRPSCAGALAEMLGIRPATVTVRTGSYAAANARAAAENKPTRLPLIAAAAAIVLGGSAGAYFLMNGSGAEKESEIISETPVVGPKSGEGEGSTSEKVAEVKDTKEEPKTSDAPTTVAPQTDENPVPSQDTPVAGGLMARAPAALSPTVPAVEIPPPTATVAAVSSPPPTMAIDPSTPASSEPGNGSVPTARDQTEALGAVVGPSPAAPSSPNGSMALAPDASGATNAALAAMTPPPGAMPASSQTFPLPPGVEIPAGSPQLLQPDLPQPSSGFWTIDQIFPVPPFATYSPKGKKYLLYKTQSALKEKGLYTSTLDGEEGKGTHNAIVLFQVREGLVANGLLDVPTLAALSLSAEPDKPDWSTPSGGGGSGGTYRRRQTQKEEPTFLQKTGETFKKLNPFK